MICDYEKVEIIYRAQIVQGEITTIRSSTLGDRVLLGSLNDETIYFWNVEMVDGSFAPSFLRLKIPGSGAGAFPISICPDPTFSEGLVSTYNGGIYYYNLDNQYASILVGSPDLRTPFRTEVLGSEFIATFSREGVF